MDISQFKEDFLDYLNSEYLNKVIRYDDLCKERCDFSFNYPDFIGIEEMITFLQNHGWEIVE